MYTLINADDHLMASATLWEDRLPARHLVQPSGRSTSRRIRRGIGHESARSSRNRWPNLTVRSARPRMSPWARTGRSTAPTATGTGACTGSRATERCSDSWDRPDTSGPGRFHVPHGVFVAADGRVFVADRQNDRVQIFDGDGTYVAEWAGFSRPCDLLISADGTLYVAELGSGRDDASLSIFDHNGRFLARWSGPTRAGAHAILVDGRGAIYLNQNREGQRLLKSSGA